MVRVTFVMEQHVGLYTYYLNLREFIDATASIAATWVPVTYFQPGSPAQRVPFLPGQVRAALHGRAQARRGITRTASDVLFFNTQVPAALASGALRRRPYLVSTDVTPVQFDRIGAEYGHRADRAGLMKRYKHLVNTRVFRGAVRLLPWSRWVAGSLVSDYGVDPRRIEVVPPGVDLTRWRPAARDEDGTVRILFVGGDLKRKGGSLLLQAFRAIRAPGVELHVITRGSLPGEAGLFVHDGLQPNSEPLRELYRRCDLFCLPTRADCLPLGLIEAAATGLPMVATDVAAIPEVVRHGETGFLIGPDDLGGLVESLRSLVADAGLRGRMGRSARRDAEARFDARRNGHRVVELLLEAAGARADPERIDR